MSIMHIAGGILIGLLIGRAFSIFSLRNLKGGKYTYMIGGVVGSLLFDFIFKVLYQNEYVSGFFYKQHVIIFEMIIGALVVCYLLSKLGSRKDIDFE